MPVVWIGSSREDIRRLSGEVQDVLGLALMCVQAGGFPPEAKPLHGALSGVNELRANDAGGTYRAVYTHRLRGVVYVLHVFQKKSAHGHGMSRRETELILRRLAIATDEHAERSMRREEGE